MKQIGKQNIKEKPTNNAIIAVIKSAIEIKFPSLHEIINLHDINLDEVYKKNAKSATSKKKVDNLSESMAASLSTKISLYTMTEMHPYSGHLEQKIMGQ